MDVNNTNSVLEEQFDDVKNNTENAVEAADNATETVNENESEKVIDEPEVAVEVADDAPEIVNENESEKTIDEPEVAVEAADDAPEIVNENESEKTIDEPEVAVEAADDAPEIVNENESEKTIDEPEAAVEAADDAPEIDNENESEILIDETEIDIILSEKLTDEDDDISLQKADDEIIDFSIEEAFIAAESEEFDLEDDEEIDLDSDEDTEVSSNFSEMNKAELNVAFRNILETQPVEKIRKDVDAVKTSFYKILRQEQDVYRQEYIAKGNDIESYIAPVDKYEIEFKSLFNSYKVKRSAYLRNLENNKEDNYKIKLKLIDELKELIDKKENINHTFQAFKELQKRWRETGPIPQSYMKDLWDTYNHHVENFYDYLKINKELRDMDLKKNLEAKIQLCEKAEELLIEPSVVTAFRKLQKYHEQWREIGPVANELKEQIWERFKEATSKINKKHQEYFEQQKGLQEQNLKAKLVLCEKIEELVAAQTKTNKEWNKSSKILIEMQKAWKSIGFASKKDNGKIYLRFRKACDEFFTKKRKFYSEFKKSMDGNLHLKLDLCKQAEALSENTDWKKTTEQLIKLQKEWKEIGVVPRKVSAEVWKRFRTACDKFFNSRNSVLKEQDTRYDENLKAKQAIIKEVKEYEAGRDVVRNLDALKDFQRRWAAIGFVPIKNKTQIQTEFRTLVDNLFKSLNISETDRKIVKFRTQLKNTQTGGGGKGQTKTLRSERDKLLGQIRQIEADIALWENNIGFFAKSKNADTFVSEVKRKIEKSKEEVIVLEEKIKLLDQTI